MLSSMGNVPPLAGTQLGSHASSGQLGTPRARGRPTGCPATASDARASRPQSPPINTASITQALNSTGKWCHVVDEATNMVFNGNIAKYHGTEATYSCADAAVKVEEALACPQVQEAGPRR